MKLITRILKENIKRVFSFIGVEVRRAPRSTLVKKTAKTALYNTSTGKFYLPADAPHDVVIRSIKRGEIFEREIVDMASRYILPGTIAIDVGANFGQMAMIFSEMVGASGKVHAFEAQKGVYDLLEKNIKVNAISNIVTHYAAVFHESGREMHFPDADIEAVAERGSFGSLNIALGPGGSSPVKSLKIDDVNFDKSVSFMKIDVQGCDLFALQGARQVILKHKMPIIFEFEQQYQQDYDTNFGMYVDFVDSIGYAFREVILDRNFLVTPRASN